MGIIAQLIKKMKKFLILNKNGFTLVEILISIIISGFVLLWMTYFIWRLNSDIATTQNKSDTYLALVSLVNKIKKSDSRYSTPKVLVDNPSWYDVVLLLNSWSLDKSVLLWVVDMTSGSPNYGKLDPVSNYSKYWKKLFWIKQLTATQTSDLLVSTWSLYSITFYDDNVIDKLYTSSFVATSYNSWSLVELKLDLEMWYNPSLNWKSRSSIILPEYMQTTLNF